MHGIVHYSQQLVDFAYLYAREAHGNQLRKYTGELYIGHPVEVARLVASVTTDVNMICAAFLHDVVEDTPRTFQDIHDAGFRHPITNLVRELTDVSRPEDGNRATRKAIDRAHLAKASPEAKTVKLADLISNTQSIAQHDPSFAKVYMQEVDLLILELAAGHPTLLDQALLIIDDYHERNSHGNRQQV